MKNNIVIFGLSLLFATHVAAQQFTYDAVGQLTSVRYDATRRIDYKMDLAGNTTNLIIAAAQSETDTDADGMADAWEWVYFNSLAQAASGDFNQDTRSNLDHYLNQTDPADPDTDGDGMSNHDELITGTNPLDPASALAVMTTQPAAQGFVLRWQSVTGQVYWIGRSSTFTTSTWSRIAGPIMNTAPMNTHTDTTATGSASWWYRIEVDRP